MSDSGTGSKQTNGVRHRTVTVNGLDIFYREGGPVDAPTLVLLHGFPATSHQYARLMGRLSDRVHVIALDYPGSATVPRLPQAMTVVTSPTRSTISRKSPRHF